MTIHGISSMATKLVLAELSSTFAARTGIGVTIESTGGVDAAKRIRAGEALDLVILGSDAIDALIASGHLAGPRVDLVRSGVAAAVRKGAFKPDISTEAALRNAVLMAPSLGYSTGPSGLALAKLFERWGITEEISGRLITPPPGVPVGSLVAAGEIELGFQQLSELLHVPGISIVGPLPPEVQITTIFSGALCAAGSPDGREAVGAFLAFIASPEAEGAKRRQGMESA